MAGDREAIFKTFDCRIHPCSAGGAVPLSSVVPGFTASLNELKGIIAKNVVTGHKFAGKEIAGGERLHTIVVGLCEAINRTGDICPPRFAKLIYSGLRLVELISIFYIIKSLGATFFV